MKIQAQLRRWQECLLDQTARNPLLHLHGSRTSRLCITSPDALALFRMLVVEGRKLKLPRVKASAKKAADETLRVERGEIVFAGTAEEVERRVRRIQDNARTSLEERGVASLHVAVGTLHWSDARLGGDAVSPLWLVPCRLETHGPDRPWTLETADEDVHLNPALELYLRERHKIRLPEPSDEPTLEEVTAVLEAIGEAARERGWRVESESWLSTFSFESLVLWRDLEAMEAEAEAHPIVRAFARLPVESESGDPLPEDLDSIDVPVPILESDSSQLEALALAAQGRNLVIHGPPGTGKSQTISNLIADALGRGKTVLFVSAKMAALEVVHRRLVERGLGDYCLEAHSARGGKTRIIAELKRVLENAELEPESALEARLQDLVALRDRLNGYARGLHEPRGQLGLSLYDAIGRAEELRFAPELRFSLPWRQLLEVSPEEFEKAREAIEELSAEAAVFDARERHPWRGYCPPVDGPELEPLLESIAEIAKELESLASTLGIFTGPVCVEEIAALCPALEVFAAGAPLPDEWWERDEEELRAEAERLEKKARLLDARDAERARLRAYIDASAPDAISLLGDVETRWDSWSRVLQPSWHRWMAGVRTLLPRGARATPEDLRAALGIARRVMELEDRCAGLTASAADLRASARAHLEAARVTSACARAGLPCPALRFIPDAIRLAARATLAHLAAIADGLHAIDLAWPDGFDEGEPATRLALPALAARCAEILDARGQLDAWLRMSRAHSRAVEAGLTPLLDALGARSARHAREAFERRFHLLFAQTVVRSDEVLGDFHGDRQERSIEKFGELDLAARRAALRRIHEQVSRRAVAVRTAPEAAALRRELQKRRGIKPLRKLFAESAPAVQALKACFLMSPTSVSTHLAPGAMKFDLVVFDEASQIPTPQAIPAILRATQTVVAGDPRQLPPSSFFEANLERDEDDDESVCVEPLESLLDECVAAVPAFHEAHLRWHYRSQDERLIQFSNRQFYENRLITFPSTAVWAPDRGVALVHVADGVWDRGRTRCNVIEARRVAELVCGLLREDASRSIGVIAMNLGQKEAIADAIAVRLESEPELRRLLSPAGPEPFFVKSLENVQGDERDVIVVSLGYARDASGHLALNFGPLNNDGGWRRLNVLVTRARRQTLVVSSLRATDLAGVNAANRGATSLRDYLEYAEQGAELPETQTRAGDAFSRAVKAALEERGFAVDEQVGIGAFRIDLGVRHPDDPARYVLGIECDGPAQASARTARDRDLLRPSALESKGWRLHRVWSVDWFRDRERALEKLLRALSHARVLGNASPDGTGMAQSPRIAMQ